jgi:SAM-dependent methyltransferase
MPIYLGAQMNIRASGSTDVLARYKSGAYADQHSGWHIDDGPGKALDVWDGIEDAIAGLILQQKTRISICEVGCGTGAILRSIRALVEEKYPDLAVDTMGIDIADCALEIGRREFPEIRLISGDFLGLAEKFDIILFADVLEHLENPFAFMKHAEKLSSYMVVRQPLQGNIGLFTKNLYPFAIDHWGHIQFFNYRNFQAIAAFCGWKASKISLVPDSELKTSKTRPNVLKSMLSKWNPVLMSQFVSGFYLNGSFRRIADQESAPAGVPSR